MKKIIALILMFFVLSLPCHAVADEMENMDRMSAQLKKAIKNIDRGRFEGDDLGEWTKLSIKTKSAASLCVSNTEAALLDLKTVMDGLGEKVKGEDIEVTKKRSTYQKENDELGKVLAKCNLFITTSEELAARIKEAEKSYFKQKYLAKSPDIVELVIAYLNNPIAILKSSGGFILSRSGINEIDALDMVLSVFAILVSIYIGFWLRKKLLLFENKRQWQDEFSENLLRAILTTVSHAMPYLLGSAVAAITSIVITIEVKEIPFVTEFFVGLLIFFMVITSIRFLTL